MSTAEPAVETRANTASASVGAQGSGSANRLVELDVLRGFLLLWMTLTHLPTSVSIVSNQTFGFVSGAEGFIFLAAFMVGQLEHRKLLREGGEGVFRDLGRRTLRVYLYHCGLLSLALVAVTFLPQAVLSPSIQNLFSFYLQQPKAALAAAALLLYRPALFDILPIYIVFLPLSGLALSAARRWGWPPVLAASAVSWLAAQFGLRHLLYVHLHVSGWIPEASIGAFDLWAWQLLWLAGLALGTTAAQGRTFEVRKAAKFALPVAAILFVLRYSSVSGWMNPDLYGHLVDKWHLGAVRLINFAAITILLMRFGRTLARPSPFQWLAPMGQASIEVFCVHIACCLLADNWSRTPDPSLGAWQQAVVLVLSISALFATAALKACWSARTAGSPRA